METISDYISILVLLIIIFISLRFFIGILFYDENYNYSQRIDIFTDYEDFED